MVSASSTFCSRSGLCLLLLLCTVAALLQSVVPSARAASIAEPTDCAQIAAGDEERLLLCQLYESSALLAQLGALVNEGIERLASNQGLTSKAAAGDAGREKRKHEFVRFGKRKHEFVRF